MQMPSHAEASPGSGSPPPTASPTTLKPIPTKGLYFNVDLDRDATPHTPLQCVITASRDSPVSVLVSTGQFTFDLPPSSLSA